MFVNTKATASHRGSPHADNQRRYLGETVTGFTRRISRPPCSTRDSYSAPPCYFPFQSSLARNVLEFMSLRMPKGVLEECLFKEVTRGSAVESKA